MNRKRRMSNVDELKATLAQAAPAPAPVTVPANSSSSTGPLKRYASTPLPAWCMRVIPDENLKVLENYKYHGTDLSILVELFLRRFWNWCIEFFPLWLAPNMITTLGFIALVSTYVVAIYYCPTGINCATEVPRWVYALGAFNLFFYQLMDNLDGKQARRTGTSSPLGELFDHGCDSLFLMLIAVPLAQVLGVDADMAFFMHALSLAMFYSAHWEEYHSGHLVLQRFANPTEGQVAIMLALLGGAILGPAWFKNTTLASLIPFVTFPEIIASRSIGWIILMLTNVGCVFSVLDNSWKLVNWANKNNENHFVVQSRFLPIVISPALFYVWISYSRISPQSTYTVLTWMLVCLISSYLTIHIMICRITKMNYTMWHWIMSVPLLLALNVVIPGEPLVNEVTMLYTMAALLFSYYWYYVASVVIQLACFLGIHIFTIRTPAS